MNKKNLLAYKANKIVEAGYKLSLNEQRVILACINQANSTQELLATDKFELSSKDFALLFSVSENNACHALIEVTETLFNRYVVIDDPYPDNPRIKRLKIRWLSVIEYLPDDAKIKLCFSQKMLPFLSELKDNFTRYKLEHIGKMTCIHAVRLYGLLMQWQNAGVHEIEIDCLKKQFQLNENYSRLFDFKKRVLAPAVKDINEHSNFQVTWTQRKTGRQITHLIFHFSEKIATEVEKPI